jgi:CDP-glycerol glycerophosphotransferase
VRRTLGIGDETTAVLYAPTWRDDVVFADGQDVMRADGDPIALDLDVDRFVAALGASHALLLRLHYTLTGRLAAVAHASVADVSRHSDIGELYLAADVLVTDYSSAMFDFAVTGKPIVFLAADLDRYRDSLRGFYFDLFADAPAPVTVTTDELIRALGDLEAGAAAHAERYARFRETFCPFDDGGATERLVDRLFEGGELRRPSEARAAD